MKARKKVKSLEQVRIMAHPLRMKLLEVFSYRVMTTKQAAEELGEKPTRLYHHVNAMERVGLIELVRRRRKRGTVEKYYRTAAEQFIVDRSLFGIAPRGKAPLNQIQRMTSEVLENAVEEIRQSLAERVREPIKQKGQFVLAHTHINATPAQIAALEKKINALIKKQGFKKGGKGSARYGVTLAVYRTGSKIGTKRRREK